MGLLVSIRSLVWCQFLACSFFVLLFGWHIFQGNDLTALMYLGGTMVIILSLLIGQNSTKNNLQLLSYFIFSGYTLISLLLLLIAPQKNIYLHLSLYLAYPLLAFYSLSFKPALFFVIGFSILANLLLMLQLEGTLRAAYIITFWLVTLLTSLNRFAHFTRQETLQKKLNRDPKTQLLNHQQFLLDLQKEQERAQREATFLGVLSLTSKNNFDFDSVKELTSNFAAYEEIYSLSAFKLVVLIPLANPKDFKLREKKLAKQLPHLTIVFKLSSLENPLVNDFKPTQNNFGQLYE